MQEILFEYEMHPTTWFYVSSLMMVGVFFKFHRFFSVRNLDLLGLVAFTPGLLLIAHRKDELGYAWLFTVGTFFLVRLLLDTLMVRRPLLEPNLSAAGLTFTGGALFVFLMANVITSQITVSDTVADFNGSMRLEKVLSLRSSPADEEGFVQHGPGYPMFHALANASSTALTPDDEVNQAQSRRILTRAVATRAAAILGHLAVVVAIVLIGYRHFGNVQTGVAAASLYLMLPYTSQMTGRVDHVIPAALIVSAVASYRRPEAAGALIGLAGGLAFYPLFLLPLWIGFYWHRGAVRFVVAAVVALAVLVLLLAVSSADLESFWSQLQLMFGATALSLEQADCFWKSQTYLVPVAALFLALCVGMALWPAHKNLGTLLSCSAAVLLSSQFLMTHQGGLYMAWYLPLLVLTIFRPNLEDRVALTAVGEGRRTSKNSFRNNL
jgi:hypothetical protein